MWRPPKEPLSASLENFNIWTPVIMASYIIGGAQCEMKAWAASSKGRGKVKWKSLSCVRLCDPTHCSPSGSSVHGILQARILEWVDIPFSRESSWPRYWTQVSCIAGISFTVWATREVQGRGKVSLKILRIKMVPFFCLLSLSYNGAVFNLKYLMSCSWEHRNTWKVSADTQEGPSVLIGATYAQEHLPHRLSSSPIC